MNALQRYMITASTFFSLFSFAFQFLRTIWEAYSQLLLKPVNLENFDFITLLLMYYSFKYLWKKLKAYWLVCNFLNSLIIFFTTCKHIWAFSWKLRNILFFKQLLIVSFKQQTEAIVLKQISEASSACW